jgi:hypothetical protein
VREGALLDGGTVARDNPARIAGQPADTQIDSFRTSAQLGGRMTAEKATLLVTCRFPTGTGNRVRVFDEKPVGALDGHLSVRPGEHLVRVTSWGLPLCGPLAVSCSPGTCVTLALKVCFSGFVLGLVIYLTALAALGLLVAALGPHWPAGFEALLVLVVIVLALGACLLDFYVLLPAFSIYTFWLVETGEHRDV